MATDLSTIYRISVRDRSPVHLLINITLPTNPKKGGILPRDMRPKIKHLLNQKVVPLIQIRPSDEICSYVNKVYPNRHE